jgi:predicted SAM-dependent methyltransferase
MGRGWYAAPAMLDLEGHARRWLPRAAYGFGWRVYHRLLRPLVRRLEAGSEHECPLCASRLREFRPFRGRSGEKCPVCGSMKRHRLVWLYMKRETDLLSAGPKRMLHVAPEPPIAIAIQGNPQIDYLSIDLDSPFADRKMDVTALELPDASFDAVYCSHVLEHVPNDRMALSELRRILRPGGWAILQVPISGEVTREDPKVTDPAERKRRYGHPGHVRAYGRDYAARLRGAGFAVEVVPYAERLGAEATARFGLAQREEVYFCRRADD